MFAVLESFLIVVLLLLPSLIDGCADVVAATASQQASDGSWTFAVTVSSNETGWDKYADAWEIRGTFPNNGTVVVLGTRVLLHPHVNEQPFTRSLSGVVIPASIDVVTLAARDSVEGFCGTVFPLELRPGDENGMEDLLPKEGSSTVPSTDPSMVPSMPAAETAAAASNEDVDTSASCRIHLLGIIISALSFTVSLFPYL